MSDKDIIVGILKDKLKATHVEIIDESGLHKGHKAAGGGGHYAVTVISDQFKDVNLLDQRRMVYSALEDEIAGTPTTPKLIHALQIKTMTPDEWEK